jgi:hypothetical protein
MRTKLFLILIILTAASAVTSCVAFKETLMIDQVIAEKEKIETSKNPAKRYLLQKQLSDKSIVIENVIVKSVAVSTNIDYDFCVVADIDVADKKIECYIYSKNVKIISQLMEGKTKVNVKGEFGKFFSVLDDYYTRVEIIKASINITED